MTLPHVRIDARLAPIDRSASGPPDIAALPARAGGRFMNSGPVALDVTIDLALDGGQRASSL